MRRSREAANLANPIEDHHFTGRQIQQGIQSLLGNNVAFHHVFYMGGGITFNQLFETREELEAKREEHVQHYQTPLDEGPSDARNHEYLKSCQAGVDLWRNTVVRELAVGAHYLIEGKPGFPQNGYPQSYTHGIDDGTHGSIRKE